jgi:hypothetical protein
MAEFIKIYNNVLSDTICQEIINFFDTNSDKTFKFDHDWRRSECMTILNNLPNNLINEVTKTIREYFDKYKNEINYNGGSGSLNFCNLLESPNLLKYNNNADLPEHFNLHSDNWSIDSSTRQVSVILYLNDVEDGGETDFPYYNLSIKPKKGTLLMFPSFFNYSHLANQPKSNCKYVIVTWIHFNGKTPYHTISF